MTGHDMNQNLGYDQKVYQNNITLNTGHINRQRAADSGNMTAHGKGILIQAEVSGSDSLHNLWYKNNQL